MDILADGSLKLEIDDLYSVVFAFDMCPEPLNNCELAKRLRVASVAMDVGLFLESGEREAMHDSIRSIINQDGNDKVDPREVERKAGLEGAATIVPASERGLIQSLYPFIRAGSLDSAQGFFEERLPVEYRGKDIGRVAAEHWLDVMDKILEQLGT